MSLALHGEHAQTNFPASEYNPADLAQFQVGRMGGGAVCVCVCVWGGCGCSLLGVKSQAAGVCRGAGLIVHAEHAVPCCAVQGLEREDLQRALGVKPMDKSSRWAAG